MNDLLGTVSTVKAIKRSIADTGANHEMEPNYEYSLSYQHYSIRYYANLCNGERGPIMVYGTTLLQLGGKEIYNQNILHVPGLMGPYTHCTITVASTIVYTLGTTKVPTCDSPHLISLFITW